MNWKLLPLWLWALALFALLSGSAAAQPNLLIADVRLGFPEGPGIDWFKPGAWVPVVVELGTPSRLVNEVEPLNANFEGRILISCVDGDGQVSTYPIAPVFLKQGDISRSQPRRTFLGYLRAGRTYSTVEVVLLDAQNRRIHEFKYPDDRRNSTVSYAAPHDRFLLALGKVPGLAETEVATDEKARARSYSRGAFHFAQQTRLENVPQFWFGYEGIDTIILPTGGNWSGSFVQALVNDPVRRSALEQWVAQGGHLVVCVAGNAANVANRQTFPLEPLLPAVVDPVDTAKAVALTGLGDFINREVPREERRDKSARVAVLTAPMAKLTPRGTARVLVSEPGVGTPAIVYGAYGLGRVTLLAFDVDQGPFVEWENRHDLWTALLDLKSADRERARRWDYVAVDVGESLANNLEQFGDVTVVSFSWVALFILIYILLIGPVDYFILKKVVKRLELTWITFPTLVLTVSVVAYFVAYYLKGDEIRINKIDVVDVDVGRQRAVGSTFLSIFSPRLQNYDVTLRPQGLGTLTKDTLAMSWLPRPGAGARGMDRSQTPDLFRRAYYYADDGSRLIDVPIQVWAMKSLMGRWQTQLETGAPLIRHTLRESKLLITGTVTSLLSQPLRQARLVYRDGLWDLGTLEPGKPVAVPTQFQELRKNNEFVISPPPRARSGAMLVDYSRDLNSMLFHQLAWQRQDEQGENAYYRFMDQSWRLKLREALLVGVLQDEYGPAEQLNAAIPLGTQLEFAKPPLRGVMRQMTVIRFNLELPVADR